MYLGNPAPSMGAIQPTSNYQDSYDNFDKNYWAPDRDQVLAQKQQQQMRPAPIGQGSNNNGTAIGAASSGFMAPGGMYQGQQQGGQVGQYQPQGYDMTKWNNPNKHDAKYDIGRILSKYPPSPAGLAAAKAEIEATGLANVTGDDTINLTPFSGYGGHTVDVGQNFKSGQNMNWYWGDQNSDPNAVANPAGPMMQSGIPTDMRQFLGPTPYSNQYQNMIKRTSPFGRSRQTLTNQASASSPIMAPTAQDNSRQYFT